MDMDTTEDIWDENILGEESFGKFYVGSGYKALTNMKSEDVFKLINECIEYIWDEDEIFKAKDSTKKELSEFIESLSTDQFSKIRDYFEGMPRLKHTIKWKCPKCELTAPLVLEGIDAFFG